MAGPLLYPGADHTTQWVGKGSVTMPMDNVKWVVHTTEGISWPSYDYVVDGVTYKMGSAPTLTYDPWLHKWRQHFRINESARALKNDGSFYCNRVDVIQVEVICICDDGVAAKYGHRARDIDDRAINDLGDFGAFVVKEWGMAQDFYPEALPWPKYPAGTTRLSTSRYAAYSGVLGHMAVPGNYHLDPGDLPMDKVKAAMGGGRPAYPQWRDTMPAVGGMVARLRLAGYFNGRRGDAVNFYGAYTRAAVKRFQEAQGWSGDDADGLMGPTTWERIHALPVDPKDPPPPPPPPPPHKFPILDDPREKAWAAIQALNDVTEARPNWQWGKDMAARWHADWKTMRDIQITE